MLFLKNGCFAEELFFLSFIVDKLSSLSSFRRIKLYQSNINILSANKHATYI